MAVRIGGSTRRDRNTVDNPIPAENALAGNSSTEWNITGAGDLNNVGFARPFSLNVGTTVNFACHGSGTVIDVYRIGWYGGLGWRKVTTLTNTATTQPAAVSIASSNGGTQCSNWSNTASWAVPASATSGLYVGVYRNSGQTNASYIPFVLRDDARQADIILKTSDTTWGNAYNFYGTPGAPLTGANVYGSGQSVGTITDRCHAVSYERPIITRYDNELTYWLNAEAPLIRWVERNGLNVKYVASRDVEKTPTCLDNSKIVVSMGHDEYWSTTMRSAFTDARDVGKHLLFMSGNEVFWRTRFNGEVMWCYKDTMPGPGGHTAGTALDPVTWTGTWKDTRWGSRQPENLLTGTDFRMNGPNDLSVTLSSAASYASHPVWRNSALTSGNVTFTRVIGFEADQLVMTQPTPSTSLIASSVININGLYADDNGQNYSGNGSLNPWGIGSQRYSSGAVVVGFGTCQWQWALDSTHDRTATSTNTSAQQMMLNLFADLGAAASTPQAGLTVPTPVSLDNYGVIPS